MLATLLIVFREMIEAGMVVGIVLAATRGVRGRGLFVTYGILAGVAGACAVAAGASRLGALLAGNGQEVFNAAILSVAVLMLGWHNVWMARHGREMAAEMRGVGAAVSAGQRSLMALAVVVGVAVLREGSEVVLFLYGIIVSGGNSALSMMAGGALGLLGGACVSALMYFGLLRIPARHLFGVTGAMITLLGAGMASQAVAFLTQAGWLTAGTRTVWNTAAVLPEGSLLGRALHALMGYTDQPSQMQLLIYIATAAMIFALTKLFSSAPRRQPVALSTTTPAFAKE